MCTVDIKKERKESNHNTHTHTHTHTHTQIIKLEGKSQEKKKGTEKTK